MNPTTNQNPLSNGNHNTSGTVGGGYVAISSASGQQHLQQHFTTSATTAATATSGNWHQQQQQFLHGDIKSNQNQNQNQNQNLNQNQATTMPASGLVTNTVTNNQDNSLVVNPMIPASVVVGVRPASGQHQQPQAQQNRTTMQTNALGRVVLGAPQLVGARQQSPITLSAITPGTAPALIVKTEQGFQLLRVSTAGPVTQTVGTSAANAPAQIRLATVPAASLSGATTVTNNIVATSSAIQHQQQQLQQQQQQPQQQQQQQAQLQTIQQTNTNNNNNNGNNNIASTSTGITSGSSSCGSGSGSGSSSSSSGSNTKEKCRKFLANLIDLSTREPKPVEKNVRNLIQELIDANVEPETFCDRLEKLLNASPQPCLIGFLKKSLPLLREALYKKELVIEGIKPPPDQVLDTNNLPQQLPRIQAQIRPISQAAATTTLGPTQLRITPLQNINQSHLTRPLGQTTIARQTTPQNIRVPLGAPRVIGTHIRGPITAGLQPPQLHTTTGQSQNVVQLRTQPRATLQIRPCNTRRLPNVSTAGLTSVRVGQTHIKPVTVQSGGLHSSMLSSSQPPSLAAISSGVPSSTLLSSVSMTGGLGPPTTLPTPSLPTVLLPPGVGSTTLDAAKAAAAAADSRGEALAAAAAAAKAHAASEKLMPALAMSSSTVNASSLATANKNNKPSSSAKPPAKKRRDAQDKDDKPHGSTVGSGASGTSPYFPIPTANTTSTTIFGDDDINDVAAMGGVNLAEESQRILGCTENIGTQIRSCKDEVFLNVPALLQRFRQRNKTVPDDKKLDEPTHDSCVLISHAVQEQLKNIVTKLSVITEHRQQLLKNDPNYEVSSDVRGQLKFLEEIDKTAQKRNEELEREMLLRAAKSRSKVEDPEQAKMKARAKEMQRAELEELRQRDANMTALQAIGPRKKVKAAVEGAGPGGLGANNAAGSSTAPPLLRPRIKRVNLRDMIFFMENEKQYMKSQLLYEAYLK